MKAESKSIGAAGGERTTLVSSALVMLVALVYAAIIFWKLRPGGPGFQGSESYSQIGEFVARNGFFDTAFRPPLYPLLLAGTMKLFDGHWQIAALIIQSFCGLGCALMVGAVARKLSGSQTAAYLALFLYLTNGLFQIEVLAKRESAVFAVLILGFIYAPLFITALRQRLLFMAALASLAFLTRPNAVVLFPMLCIAAWFEARTAARTLRLLAAPALLILLIVAPWQRFVYLKSGRPPLTSSTVSGQTLWKGNNPYFLQVWPAIDIDRLDREMSRQIGGIAIASAEGDARLLEQARNYIKAHPALALERMLFKGALFFSPLPIPFGSAELAFEEGHLRLKGYRKRNAFVLLLCFFHSLLLIGGWLIFLRTAFKSTSADTRYTAAMTVAFVLLLCLLHSLTYPESRYRLPFDAAATPLAACGMTAAVQRSRRKRADSKSRQSSNVEAWKPGTAAA